MRGSQASLYKKHFAQSDFLSPKHVFAGYDHVRRAIYRHQYVSRRYLNQRLLCSSPIAMFRNDSQAPGAGSSFLYLTLADPREFQTESKSDKTSHELTSEVTGQLADRLGSFFLRSLK